MYVEKKTVAIVSALILLELILLHLFGWLQLLFGSLILFIIPGFALTLLLFHRECLTLPEVIASTIVLSITINILTVLSSNILLGIPINHASITTQILVFSLIIYLGYFLLHMNSGRKHILFQGVGWGGVGGRQFILLMLAFVLVSSATYQVHGGYRFPLHSDEWQDAARAVCIMENEHIMFIDPYLKEAPYRFDMELGFNLFLAEFFIMTGTDPVLFYQYLPAISAFISALTLFVFMFSLFRGFYPAFLSTIFFAGLKGSVVILGTWFFVAMSMSMFFIYFILYCLTRGIRQGSVSFYIAASVSMLALTLVHPGMGSFLYITVLFYLAASSVYVFLGWVVGGGMNFNLGSTLRSVSGVFIFFSAPLVSFIYFMGFIWRGSLVGTLKYFFTEFIVFGRLLKYDKLYEPFFLIDFYGVVAFLFAAVGFFFVLYRRRGGILLSGLLVSVMNLALYQFMGFNVFLFYERTVYFMLLFLVALSGVGFYLLLRFLYGLSGGVSGLSPVVSAVVFLLVAGSLFSGHGWYQARMDRLITEGDYRAIRWLSAESVHGVVLAHPRISDAVYPVSRNFVVSPMVHSYSGRNARIGDVEAFYLGDCEGKAQVLRRYGVDYVYFRFGVDCVFLREVYNESGYIYSVEL